MGGRIMIDAQKLAAEIERATTSMALCSELDCDSEENVWAGYVGGLLWVRDQGVPGEADMGDPSVPLTVKFGRLHESATLPTKARPGDACWDITATALRVIKPGEVSLIPVGIAWECPEGWYAQLLTRSSLASAGLSVQGGVIDGSYRGGWVVVMHNNGPSPYRVEAGDKVAQFAILPVVKCSIIEAACLESSDRGEGGFGSTGR